ncbi:hypothetical protein E3P78_01199 [Wallemia ichthyophaga]|nr:hypothetical protein E3P78_01199 [Wallemia ichthyophaga]
MVTYNGQIINNLDAVVLFKAVEASKLQLYKRRLTSSERMSIKSGDIFIWEECQGMQRWTDGRRWGPSRVQGGFLWYKEIEANEDTALIKQTYSLPQSVSNMIQEPKLHLVCYTNANNNLQRPSDDPTLEQFKHSTEYTTPSVLTSSAGQPNRSDRPEPIKILNDTSFSPPPTPPHSYNTPMIFTDPFQSSATITPPVSATRMDFMVEQGRRASHPHTQSSSSGSAIQAGAYAATLVGRGAARRGSSPYPSPRRNSSIFERNASFSSGRRSNNTSRPTPPAPLNLNQGLYIPPPMTSAPAAVTTHTIPTTFAATNNMFQTHTPAHTQHRPSSSHSHGRGQVDYSKPAPPIHQQHPHAYAQRASLPPIANNIPRNSISTATSRINLCDEDKRQLDSFKFNDCL